MVDGRREFGPWVARVLENRDISGTPDRVCQLWIYGMYSTMIPGDAERWLDSLEDLKLALEQIKGWYSGH